MRHDTSDQAGEDPTAGADEARAYRDFWTDVGSTFPDLYGARSTAQYLEDEQWVFRDPSGAAGGATYSEDRSLG